MLTIRRNNQLPTMENFLKEFFRGTSLINDMINERNHGDIYTDEKEDSYEIYISLPRYKKEDISINIENDVLVVSSDINDEKEENSNNYITRKFKKISFIKQFILDNDVDRDKISAKMEDGILHLKLDKIKKIDINNSKKINIE